MDKHLIILRGVPGSGKTQVAKAIERKLGAQAIRLDLDKYAPDSETSQFEASLDKARSFKYVIGELYSGRWHSSNPVKWIVKFRDTHVVHSFLLRVSLQKGYANCLDEHHSSYRPRSLNDYDAQKYKRFYSDKTFTEFALNAGATPEVTIDAEDGDWERMASEIITHLS